MDIAWLFGFVVLFVAVVGLLAGCVRLAQIPK
jgi:hypothetical protein